MKKALFLLLIIGLILSAYYVHDNLYYRDGVEFLCPLDTKVLRLRYDEYGDGHYGAKRRKGGFHKGIDVLAEPGDPVMAVKSGWAVSKLDKDGYGNYVEMHHKGGFMSRYGHLEATSMRWIRKVRQGDVIGWAGKTGNARYNAIKPHIHFEIRKDGIPIDPSKRCFEEPVTK
ncbi:M23 family metallopeptidase [Omnitrophica bacterium]|nr:M23 family metallopeptidase [Candidatus Omnitrophota bacterium]